MQLAKEERAKGADAKAPSTASNVEAEEQPSNEKARLARTESNASIELSRGRSEQDDLEAQRHMSSEEDVRTGRPLMSPSLSTDAALPEGEPSEKARGKMRAGRSMSEEMTGSLERLAASGVGRNGFVPTQDWVSPVLVIDNVCD